MTLTTAAPARATAAETGGGPSGYAAGSDTGYSSGADSNAASTQTPLAPLENGPTSMTTLSVGPGPYEQGEPIALTANVTCQGSTEQPAGYVRFHALTLATGQEAASTAAVGPDGVAEGELRLLAGEREIWAEHVGSTDTCTGGESARVPVTVTAAAPGPGQGPQVHIVVSPTISVVVTPRQSVVVSPRVFLGHRMIKETSRVMPSAPVLPVTG